MLRLSLPDAFGRRIALPVVARYLERWPNVRVDLSITDRPVDLVEEGFDLVIRLAPGKAPAGMVSRLVSHFRASLCAAPSYLDVRGHPPHIDALSTHECIVFRADERQQMWRFSDAFGRLIRVPVRGRLRVDSGEAIREAALLGLGIAYLPDFVVRDDLEAGRLVEVLPNIAYADAPVVALYPTRRQLQPRVRHFIDLMVDELAPPKRPWPPITTGRPGRSRR